MLPRAFVLISLGVALVAFVLLSAQTFATGHTCAGQEGSLLWQPNTFLCDVTVGDTLSELQVCQYRVYRSDQAPPSFTNYTPCSGTSQIMTLPIPIGSLETCSLIGINKCILDVHAEDNATNTEDHTFRFDIDYQSPSASITATDPAGSDHTQPGFNATMEFADQTAGSWLGRDPDGDGFEDTPNTTCEYRVLSNGIETLPWTSAGDCFNEAGPVSYVKTISVGAGQNCRDEGANACEVRVRTIDQAELTDEKSYFYNITLNQDPIATDDMFTVNEDATLNGNVITNTNPNGADSDPDLDPITVTGNTAPTNGSLTGPVQSNGAFTFNPDSNECGNNYATFTYDISDGNGGTDTATVTIHVTCVNDAPDATGDSVSVNEDDTVLVTLRGSDIETCELTFSIVSGPTNGGLSSITNNVCSSGSPNQDTATVWYSPDPNYNGSDSFTFRVSDGGLTDDALISITINSLNDAPTLNNISDSPDPVGDNESVTFQGNWSDVDSSQVAIHVCKTDSLSGQTCTGGSWCDGSLSSANPASCVGTSPATSGNYSYWGFVCDNGGVCSSSRSGSFFVDGTAPTIQIGFQAGAGTPIAEANPEETFYIYVGDSTDNVGITLVRFAADSNQNGIVEGAWTQWYNWNTSTGPWNAPSKRTSWSFSASGDKEVWVEAQDGVGNIAQASENFYINFKPVAGVYLETSPGSYTSDEDDDLSPQYVTGRWHNNDFTRFFNDSDPDGTVTSCGGTVWSIDDTQTLGYSLAGRPCSTPTTFQSQLISVGSGLMCTLQGLGACQIYAQNQDNDGQLSEYGIATYNIDWDSPVVGVLDQTQVQSGVPTTLSASVSDNLGTSACWGSLDGGAYNPMTLHPSSCEEDPITSCPGGTCKACLDTTVSQGPHTLDVLCSDHFDQESQQYLNSDQQSSPFDADSISVTLDAIPASGTESTLFDLQATVTSTFSGDIQYIFDCDTAQPGTDLTVLDPATSYTAADLCQYSLGGGGPQTFTAQVTVNQEIGNAQDSVGILVSPNTPASTLLWDDNSDTANYCAQNPGPLIDPPITVSWEFDDPDPGDEQTSFQVQVNTSDTWGAPLFDSGEISTAGQGITDGVRDEYGVSNFFTFSYGTTYFWRVQVKDQDLETAGWSTAAQITQIPVHAYPNPDFAWSPSFASAEEQIDFTDATNFDPGSVSRQWTWDFGCLVPDQCASSSSALQNPTQTYLENNSYLVQLQAQDDAGICVRAYTVPVTPPFPEFEEVSPF